MFKRVKIINVTILIVACILLSQGLFLPYVKSWEVGALELFAKNHLFYGLDITKGIPIFNLIDGKPNYYVSHPPLVPLLISLSFRILGIHEWSARLVPIIFSLLGLTFFYFLVEHISDKQTALYAAIFMTFMPMFSYYGRIVNYEAVTLSLCLIFIYGFIKFIHTERRIFLIIAVISTILGAFSDWPFYLIFPALFPYVKSNSKSIKLLIGLAVSAFVIGIGSILACNYLISLPIKAQFHPFFHRCQYKEFLINFHFYRVLIGRAMTNFTPFAGIFLLIWLFRIFKNRYFFNENKNLLTGVLFIFGLALLFIAPQAAYIHDWALQYLIPGVALLSGLVITKFKKAWQYIIILLFIIYSLNNLIIKHYFYRNYGAYEAGKLVAKLAMPDDTLYINEISPVSFYAGIESNFFGGRGVIGKRENPKEFIAKTLPSFVCIIRYAIEPRYDYGSVERILFQNNYKSIYNNSGVVLWRRR